MVLKSEMAPRGEIVCMHNRHVPWAFFTHEGMNMLSLPMPKSVTLPFRAISTLTTSSIARRRSNGQLYPSSRQGNGLFTNLVYSMQKLLNMTPFGLERRTARVNFFTGDGGEVGTVADVVPAIARR